MARRQFDKVRFMNVLIVKMLKEANFVAKKQLQICLKNKKLSRLHLINLPDNRLF
jgi:hypothetical protein